MNQPAHREVLECASPLALSDLVRERKSESRLFMKSNSHKLLSFFALSALCVSLQTRPIMVGGAASLG